MFSPPNITLTTVGENQNIRHNIVYVEDTTPTYGATGVGVSTGGIAHRDVVITTTMPNPTIKIKDNTITGYYTDPFDNTISYRTVNDTFVTVSKWQDIAMAIANGVLSELYYYKADTRQRIIYKYTASWNGHSKEYQVNVDNDWMAGRNQLIKVTNLTHYQKDLLVQWINNNSDKAPWANNVLNILDIENYNT
jgi:hypothetical protein